MLLYAISLQNSKAEMHVVCTISPFTVRFNINSLGERTSALFRYKFTVIYVLVGLFTVVVM